MAESFTNNRACYLHGIGHFHPETILDNAFIESLDIGAERGWVSDRVGIEQRRTVLPLEYIRVTRNKDPRAAAECASYSNLQTATYAARQALDRAGLEASAIGMVIAGGCSPETTVPAEACRIAAAMQMDAVAFDLNASCVSFLAHLHYLCMADKDALPDFILIVNPENNTRVTDYSDRNVAVLWGDGTTAAVVSLRVPSAVMMRNARFGSDPTGADLIRTPTGGHFKQNGHAVQQFAIRKTADLFQGGQLRDTGPANYYVGHQANLRMLESSCRRSGIAPEAHWSNVAFLGNCGAAGAPSVLSQHWDVLRGSHVRMAVVGAGLNWGSVDLHGEGIL